MDQGYGGKTTTRKIGIQLRDCFITGLAVITPLAVTIYVLIWIFNFFDGILKPVTRLTGYDIPGISLLLTVVLVISVGAFTKMAYGKKAIEVFEKLLLKLPLVKGIYTTIKHASAAFFTQKSGFQRVVLVEYPRKGIFSIGFTTAISVKEIQEKTKENVVNIFIPTSPNPTSGMLIMVPEKNTIPLKMTPEEGLRLVVSGGFSSADAEKKITVEEAYWTKDNDRIEVAGEGDKVVANVVIRSIRAVDDTVVLKVRKDLGLRFDKDVKRSEEKITLDENELTILKLEFVVDRREKGLVGYFVEVNLDGDTIYTMKDEYPPRLEIRE